MDEKWGNELLLRLCIIYSGKDLMNNFIVQKKIYKGLGIDYCRSINSTLSVEDTFQHGIED